jgi:hypothetical protein
MSGVVITLHPSAAGVSSKLFLFLFSLSRFASQILGVGLI